MFTIASRPLLLVLLEVGLLLGILHLGTSPLGTDIPATFAAVVLFVGEVLVAIVVIDRRLGRLLPWAEGAVGLLFVVTAAATLCGTPAPDIGPEVGFIATGGLFVASAIVRRQRGAA